MLLQARNVRKAELGLKTAEKHLAVFLAGIFHSFPSRQRKANLAIF